MGLFGATSKSSTIQNVNLASINMTVGYFSGGLVGINGGAIKGVIVNGNVVTSGEYVGGLAGVNSGAISRQFRQYRRIWLRQYRWTGRR